MSQNNPNTPGSSNAQTGTSNTTTGTGSRTGSSSNQSLTASDSTPKSQNANSGGTATATALAQEYGQKIADAASTAKDYVSDKVSVVGDKIKDLQNVDINEVANQAKDYARTNPGQAILISAAAGLVLGMLLSRGRR
jgi:ElaB/YqjD/DUF883 family membrane-anchored ribosome-binding protein